MLLVGGSIQLVQRLQIDFALGGQFVIGHVVEDAAFAGLGQHMEFMGQIAADGA